MTDHMSAKAYREMIGMELPQFQVDFTGVRVPRKHEEDDLTIMVADYCQLLITQGKVVEFSHIPQETFTKSWGTKRKNKAMGVRSGVPDMLIVYPKAILFLELKKEKGGVLSPFQVRWLDALSATGKVTAVCAAGWVEAKAAIDKLLD